MVFAEKIGRLLPALQASLDNYRSGPIEPPALVIMQLRILAIIVIFPLAAVLAGCACPCAKCGVPRTPHAPCIHDLCDCNQAPPDLAAEIPRAGELLPLPAPTETYQLLDAATCQCNAATNNAVANMVELESHWATVIIECDTKSVQENFCLDRDLLSIHACQLRNESAAVALTAYYQLAGLEAQHHYLQHASKESEKTLARVQNMRESGIELPEGIDRTTILKQINQMEDRLTQMEYLRLQLNGQLHQLIGCPINEHAFYWPAIEWYPDMTPVDAELELAMGLQNRQDLQGLELLLCNLEKVTLPVARAVLHYADSTVGSAEPRSGIIHALRCCKCNEHEVPVRCRQLAIFYDDTEDKATAEIKNAVYKIGLQQHRVVIAQQTVLDLRQKLEDLTKTREVNDVAVFQLSSLRIEIDQAETELIEQVIGLKLAQVELKKAKGMLANECGYVPKLCLEGCCNGACMRCEGGLGFGSQSSTCRSGCSKPSSRCE
ncbi:TolC family protein [Bythopirellula polymerisocia]|uniref:Outer membrane efflux protein n=1 Tax=Bythopirellula polymerisocia TaxID=2528003 RepID=A0A5C6CPN8_9BACT|nr:TolC family protein [Bythopirellula polymerisocia]TWU25995.1 hypothetical protein Pla144_32100 [Bythopirellula polymerisocia]